MNKQMILCIVFGLLAGVLVGYLNSLITGAMLKKESQQAVTSGNTIRMVIDVAVLGISYIVCKKLEISMFWVLLPEVIGMTLGGMGFLLLITRRYQRELEEKKKAHSQER